MESGRRHRALTAAACWALCAHGRGAEAKRVEGRAELAAKQARVLTKFCFDFDARCPRCPESPGRVQLEFFAARSDGLETTDLGGRAGLAAKEQVPTGPEVYVALLDDEYFSFPEVSQVWDDVKCTDVLKAAKHSFRLDWGKMVGEQKGESIMTNIVEKVRPRWWYVTLVSCSSYSMELSYRMHMENRLHGWQAEFSMDAMGIIEVALLLCAVFSCLVAVQLNSLQGWWRISSAGHASTGGWVRRLHPALKLLTGACLLAVVGEAAWVAFWWRYQVDGVAEPLWACVGRLCLVTAKTLMSILLLLLAQGQCVCTPDISWSANRELVVGLALFGALSFGLETWGESDLRSTSTEYVYDTRLGTALVAVDLLWLWLYASRSWRTFQAETRTRARHFYRTFGGPLALWFATLPAVAALATLLAPWVRFKVAVAAQGLAHLAVLGVLTYTFRPSVAGDFYDLRAQEYEAVCGDELDHIMKDDDDDDDL